MLSFWGKSNPGLPGPRMHPAAFHGLDVAACAEALIRLRPDSVRPYLEMFGMEAENFTRTIVTLIALHDIGKFSREFQAKVLELLPPGVTKPARVCLPHTTLGYVLLGLKQSKLKRLRFVADQILTAGARGWADCENVVWSAIAGHHGEPPKEEAFIESYELCERCWLAAETYARSVLELFQPEALRYPGSAAVHRFSWWLAGLTTLSDWLGSWEACFPYTEPFGEDDPTRILAIYWETIARPGAQRALEAAGLRPGATSVHIDLCDLIGTPKSPSPLQTLAERIALPDGPALVVIEDVMGAGKTEAALLLAHRIMAAGRASGLYFALPTMATANAMYARLGRAHRALFAPEAAVSLVLAHGRRRDHSGFQSSILPDLSGFDEDIHQKESANLTANGQCAAWIADDRRKAFFAQVGAGTIDQAFLGVLPSRHQAMRLFGLGDKVLIVDEAHAYDSYMQGELAALLEFHAALGGSAIVLSATLPRNIRQKLVDAYRRGLAAPSKELTCEAYPLVTVVGRDHMVEEHCETRGDRARAVAVSRLGSVEAACGAIVEAAQAGAAVAWVRNAVDDAIEAYDMLAARGLDPMLFHARFAMGDRLAIEERVMATFGANENKEQHRGRVLIATQVVEQSLDLDFDLMVSDLAPIDLLIQRAGRLWRHQRDFRGNQTIPRLLVVSPDPDGAIDAQWPAPLLNRTNGVYRDPAILWRSARRLFSEGVIETPNGLRALVENVYDEQRAEAAPGALDYRSNRAIGDKQAGSSIAGYNVLKVERGYRRDVNWTSDQHIPTRLGEDTALIRLARVVDDHVCPMVDAESPERAWPLSEVSIRRYHLTEIPEPLSTFATEIAGIRQLWPAYEREMPILLLTAGGNGWWTHNVTGTEMLSYDRIRGLVWRSPPERG